MKLLSLALLLVTNLIISQTQTKIINGTTFKIVTVSNEEKQTEYIEIYRNDKKILTHITSRFDGDCSSENIELGAYKIKDASFVFYTYWASADRMEHNKYPFGFRKQVYTVKKNGKLHLTKSKLYIESYVGDDWELHKGMKYLKIEPQTAAEANLLKDYISKVEKKYFGIFVLGKNRDVLEKEVRKKIGNLIFENTKYWEEVYGKNCNK